MICKSLYLLLVDAIMSDDIEKKREGEKVMKVREIIWE